MSAEKYTNIIVIGASIGGHEATNALVRSLPTSTKDGRKYRILLVDRLGFAWYPITVLRAVAVPGWEEKVTIPLTTDRVFQAGTPHQVLAPNKVVALKEGCVVLEHPFEGSCEVPFFRCVISTGASQAVPTMPDPSWSEDAFKVALRASQEDIRKATRVVVVGGGAVGIEIAGEIKHCHPDKSVTIVHKDIGLMAPTPTPATLPTRSPAHGTEGNPTYGTPESTLEAAVQTGVRSWSAPPTDIRLSVEMEKICERMGIELKLSDRVVVPSSGFTPATTTTAVPWSEGFVSVLNDSTTPVTQDAVIAEPNAPTLATTGGDDPKPSTNTALPEWDGTFGLQPALVRLKLQSGQTLSADYVYPGCGMRPNSGIVGDADAGALDGGLVAVDEYLRVKSTSPSSIFKGQYYAIGDVAATPGYRIAHNAFASAHRAASNIVNEIKGKAVVKYNPGSAQGITVPLGPDEGAGQLTLPLPLFGEWTWIMGSRSVRLQRGKTSGTQRFFARRFRGRTECTIGFEDVP